MIGLDGRFWAGQSQGERDYQEDEFGLLDGRDLGIDGGEHAVLIVADGMGGHAGGVTASRLAVRAFMEAYQAAEGPIADRLRRCLDEANLKIADAIRADEALEGMGCTLVGAVVSTVGLEWISVGDSPLWLFHDGCLRRLNADHSMTPVLADLVAVGRMTAEEAAQDSNRHTLRSALCGEELRLVDASSQPVPLSRGDCVLVASDGLMTLSDERIAALLAEHATTELEVAGSRLLAAVHGEGHPEQDNTTVLLYRAAEDLGSRGVRVVAAPAAPRPDAQRGVPRRLRSARLYAAAAALSVVVLAGGYLVSTLLRDGGQEALETPAPSDSVETPELPDRLETEEPPDSLAPQERLDSLAPQEPESTEPEQRPDPNDAVINGSGSSARSTGRSR